MTRKSKREIENALENLGVPDSDIPDEIIITRREVPTTWGSDAPENAAETVSKTRVWRDQYGKWQSEEMEADE